MVLQSEMAAYLTQARVIRANLMKFIGTGMINGSSQNSGFNFMKFMGLEYTLHFGKKFERVWPNQVRLLEVVKVSTIV